MWGKIKIGNTSKQTLDLNKQTATLIILYHAIKADNIESFEEIELLQQIISKSPIFETNSYKEDRNLIIQVKKYCIQQDEKLLDDAIKILPPNLQKAALYMAIEMVFIDGVVTDDEKKFIEKLAHKIDMGLEKVKSAIEIFSTIYLIEK